MKKSELFFSFIQVFVDFILIIGASLFAYKLRHTAEVQSIINKEGIYNVSFDQYLNFTILIAVVAIIIFAFEGLYNIRSTRKFWKETYYVTKGMTIVLVLVMIGFFLQREWFSSRFIIVAAWFMAIAGVSIGRVMMHAFQKFLLVRNEIGVHRVLLIGSNDKIKYLCQVIRTQKRLGYKIVDHVDYINIRQIKKIQERDGIDEVIVHESAMPDDLLMKLHDYCAINNITYKFIPASLQTTKFEMMIFEGEPIIEVMHTPLDGWGKILKRIVDVIISSILIILTSPILIVAAILVKLEDIHAPIVFKNARIGSNGKEFYVYKFRYFKWKWCTTEKNPNYKEAVKYEKELIKNQSVRVGPIYKIENDPRKSWIGKFLERFSIDEFPQFFNVWKGDMSLVGPRPHQQREVDKYREYHRRLLTIKPGITGMAQISGRSDLDFEDEYRLDVYYIENWSLLLDAKILLKTPWAVLRVRKN
ncbi:MAG: sugar transferase [Candidatus Moraniibacteriota bacterium]|jgi:exopolysaccharide biosynthesis polyprenyl glycosylphosphotransferase